MKVIGKQKNSRMCYICGMDNPEGLKAQFYNMEDGSVMTKFRYKAEHQSFPQRVHGGLVSTMLDELACRAYWVKDENVLGATMSMEVKFRKPVPYDIWLLGKGLVVNDLSKFFTSEVMLTDMDNNVLANAVVKYIKLPIEKIADADYHEEMCYLIEDGITEL
ncbi:MAG: PaaI family thioesterase [Candidatus Gastranaerophilales bacterium]|nr:PaaI family thioesterase [Candidatus Gastranaerophilales bacterium]